MRHFKVHELLADEELRRLELFASHPGRTVDHCRDFIDAIIAQRGQSIGRTAVGNWLRHVRRLHSHATAGIGLNRIVADKFDSALKAVQTSMESDSAKAMLSSCILNNDGAPPLTATQASACVGCIGRLLKEAFFA